MGTNYDVNFFVNVYQYLVAWTPWGATLFCTLSGLVFEEIFFTLSFRLRTPTNPSLALFSLANGVFLQVSVFSTARVIWEYCFALLINYALLIYVPKPSLREIGLT